MEVADRSEMAAAEKGKMGQLWANDARRRGRLDVWEAARNASQTPVDFDKDVPLVLGGHNEAALRRIVANSCQVLAKQQMPAGADDW